MKAIQLDLIDAFSAFILEDKPRWTRGLPFYDAVSKFSLVEDNKQSFTTITEQVVPFIYKNVSYFVTKVPGSYSEVINGKSVRLLRWPSEREELVMRAVRYLVVQGIAKTRFNPESALNLVFERRSLLLLLKKWGHSLSTYQLDVALNVLSSATIEFKSQEGLPEEYCGKFTLLAGYLSQKVNGVVHYSVTFNQLEFEAIRTGSFRAFNFHVLFDLKDALARRIYELLLIHHTAADKPSKTAPNLPRPYALRLTDLISEGTINAFNEIRKSAKRVVAALNELVAKGQVLQFVVEHITVASNGGRPRIVDYRFLIYLADAAVSDLIAGLAEASIDNDPVALKLFPPAVRRQERRKKQKDPKVGL